MAMTKAEIHARQKALVMKAEVYNPQPKKAKGHHATNLDRYPAYCSGHHRALDRSPGR